MAKHNNTRTKQAAAPKPLQKREETTDIAARLASTPFEFMRRFGEEMDRLFGDFGLGNGLTSTLTRGVPGFWAPQVEMVEREGQLLVRADLPGLTKDDVNVEIDNDAITIEGERRSEQKENREGFYRTERSYGKFYRRLPLPEGVDAQEATATFQDGVLEITMNAPQRTESKRRRVQISGTSAPKAHSKAA
jgi:HSP20 family protein